MKRIFAVAVLLVATFVSSACYVKQDEGGNWWACETYQGTPGPTDACYALPEPPF
jgi:hypothetical protein